jgi:oxalate decarboxylase/phosphoglucose isomerase-like protein (cupin superfamily)
MNRRELLGAAGAVAAAGAVPALAAGAVAAAAGEAPTLPKSKETNQFDFSKIKPQVVRAGGTIVEAISPGQIGFIPQGYAHYIENTGTDDLRWVVVFNNTYPDDIGLSTTFGGMPTHMFTETLSLPTGALDNANKPDRNLYIVEGN